jgi:hypothetical protein
MKQDSRASCGAELPHFQYPEKLVINAPCTLAGNLGYSEEKKILI